jgi:hypothetical protein
MSEDEGAHVETDAKNVLGPEYVVARDARLRAEADARAEEHVAFESYRELAGLLHVSHPREWTADNAPPDGVIGHYVVDDDGRLTDAAADCSDCRTRFEVHSRGEAVEDWPTGAEDDLPGPNYPQPKPSDLLPEEPSTPGQSAPKAVASAVYAQRMARGRGHGPPRRRQLAHRLSQLRVPPMGPFVTAPEVLPMNRRISFAIARQSVVDYWLSHPLTEAESRKYTQEYDKENALQSDLHEQAGVLHGIRVDDEGRRSSTGSVEELVNETKRCPICQTSWLSQMGEPWSLQQGVELTALFRAYGNERR